MTPELRSNLRRLFVLHDPLGTVVDLAYDESEYDYEISLSLSWFRNSSSRDGFEALMRDYFDRIASGRSTNISALATAVFNDLVLSRL